MARLEEQDFDEKRLARRQRRKKSQLIAYIILAATCLVVFGGCAVLIYFLNGVIKAISRLLFLLFLRASLLSSKS